MKKFILAEIAASVVATPVLAAPYNNNPYQQQRQDMRQDRRDIRQDRREIQQDRRAVRQDQRQYSQWSKGQRFDSRYARNYRVVDYRAYHLRPAPRGYRWVQSGNDAVMVAIASGVIGAVIAGAIH